MVVFHLTVNEEASFFYLALLLTLRFGGKLYQKAGKRGLA